MYQYNILNDWSGERSKFNWETSDTLTSKEQSRVEKSRAQSNVELVAESKLRSISIISFYFTITLHSPILVTFCLPGLLGALWWTLHVSCRGGGEQTENHHAANSLLRWVLSPAWTSIPSSPNNGQPCPGVTFASRLKVWSEVMGLD